MGKVDATMQITAGEKLFAGKIQNVFFFNSATGAIYQRFFSDHVKHKMAQRYFFTVDMSLRKIMHLKASYI